MSNSTVDVSKLRVVELRAELKSRGLSYAGDKAELATRLQAALSQDSQDEHGDINLDSDEIDSDGVLDEDVKIHNDILDDTAVESMSDELAFEEPVPPVLELASPTKPQRTLKRKITTETPKDKAPETESGENKEASKKIVLHRTISITPDVPKSVEAKIEDPPAKSDSASASNKVKINADIDIKTRLEMRAKRFGLPVKMTEADKKAARKERFGQNATSTHSKTAFTAGGLSENVDKLKLRAERFGQNVSKIMTDIENKEKLEKRKAKFGTVK